MTARAIMPVLPSLADLDRASAIVHAVLPPTPQQRWPLTDARVGAEVWVKHENHTPVGCLLYTSPSPRD